MFALLEWELCGMMKLVENRKYTWRCSMGFLAAIFQTLVKMIIVGAVAFGGIMLGKRLRDKKDEKDKK